VHNDPVSVDDNNLCTADFCDPTDGTVHHDATAVDVATGKPVGTVALGGKPEAAVSDGVGTIFVNIEDKSELVAFDAATLAVKHHYPLAPCKEPSGMAADLAHGRIFSGCDNKLMAVTDMKTGKVVANVPIGEGVDANRFDPATGLVYLPAFNMCMDIANREEEYTPGKFYLASEFDLGKAGATGSNLGEFIAWDPVAKKKAWSIEEENMWASGAMSTAGGLVFYGNINGIIKAVDAKTGKVLWQFRVGTGITQSAVTYSVDGKQYIAVVAGRLKGPPSFFGKIGQKMMEQSPEGGILMVFSL